MSIDLSKLAFWSGANYMKRDSSSGNALVAGADTVYTEVKTVAHNLNYAPFVSVFCDIDNNGKIWARTPLDNLSEEIDLYSAGYYPRPTFYWGVDTTNLHLFFAHGNSGASNGVLYWLIYKDYGNVS